MQRITHRPDLAWRLARYTALITTAGIAGFAYLIAGAPPLSIFGATAPEGLRILALSLLMLVSGCIGGCLYNFRGLTKHMQNRDFEEQYTMTYVVRPFTGALCGFFVFTLVYGGVLTLTLGEQNVAINSRSVNLYVSIALMAGYGSQEFLFKVKEIIHTIFALSEKDQPQAREQGQTPEKDS